MIQPNQEVNLPDENKRIRISNGNDIGKIIEITTCKIIETSFMNCEDVSLHNWWCTSLIIGI